MKQIALVVSAIILGLAFGNITGGLKFSAAVCLVAGIFLVTPSLFKFRFSDFSIIKTHTGAIMKNLWINYLLLTTLALLIGYASQDLGVAAALFLLALLPGGGMVMMWIKVSGANVKVGFVIFMLNLALLLPVTLIFSQFNNVAAAYFPTVDLSAIGDLAAGQQVKPFGPFMLLIIIPFVVSRIVLKFFPAIVSFTATHQPLISKATMFGIVFYLFSLTTSQLLFQVSILDLARAGLATLVFYAVVFIIAIKLTGKTPDEKAVFWHIATRYITLALILAVFNVDIYGATFILPIMFAYFIQIGAAGFLAKMETKQPV
ncbi:MAG TPA: hypothetical protein DD729_09665 [Rhodobacteraceae bacterium]|jgi:predicted Na+-dependent transporter|nr:hypothetical protein [Paracoccaceae bacterium]